MRKRRSEIADEIMRDYYREQRWKQRIAEMKAEKEQEEKEKTLTILDKLI